jgi:hypothetical protein
MLGSTCRPRDAPLALEAMRDVEVEARAAIGDRRPVRGQQRRRAAVDFAAQPAQRVEVQPHVARVVGLDDDRPHRRHHVAGDDGARRRVDEAQVPRRMPRREHGAQPAGPVVEPLAVVEDARNLHAPRHARRRLAMRPHRHRVLGREPRRIADVVDVMMREHDGLEPDAFAGEMGIETRLLVGVRRRRVDRHRALRLADDVAVGARRRRQRRRAHGKHADPRRSVEREEAAVIPAARLDGLRHTTRHRVLPWSKFTVTTTFGARRIEVCFGWKCRSA